MLTTDAVGSLSLSLQSSAIKAGSGYPNGYPALGNSRGSFRLPSSRFVITYCITVFLLLGTVCPRHPHCPVLPSCPLSRAFPYLQPGDADGRCIVPAICQSLTSADPTDVIVWLSGVTEVRDAVLETATLRRTEGHKQETQQIQEYSPMLAASRDTHYIISISLLICICFTHQGPEGLQ